MGVYEENKRCKICDKEFIVKYIIYPSNCDDKRETEIYCPHCHSIFETIVVRGNEDIDEISKKQ